MATICEIQTCINNLTTACDAAEFAILAAQAYQTTCNNLSFTVATVADLPDLYTSNIPDGQMVFVSSLAVPVVASKYYYQWLTMDGRLVRKDGLGYHLWTWGYGFKGQLGTSITVNLSSPVTTSGGGNTWCQISSGRNHSTAVKTDGTLWTWGCNTVGQLGNGSVVDRSSPGTTVAGGSTWCAVGIGTAHTAGIKTDGSLWTWGGNTTGALGTNTTQNRNSPGTTEGGGTIWCAVSGGSYHTAAVKTDGTLWTWGSNNGGRLGNGTVTNRSSPGQTCGLGSTWCAASSGGQQTSGVKSDGTLWTWGYNTCGQLGDGTITSRCSPGTTAGGGSTWCQISMGQLHTSAIKTDGTLWTWGRNTLCGQLGDLTAVNRSSPGTTAGGGTTWCQTSAGGYHSSAVTFIGTLWTWGRNNNGQLGDLTTVNRSSPITTSGGGTSWCAVSAGLSHTMAIAAC